MQHPASTGPEVCEYHDFPHIRTLHQIIKSIDDVWCKICSHSTVWVFLLCQLVDSYWYYGGMLCPQNITIYQKTECNYTKAWMFRNVYMVVSISSVQATTWWCKEKVPWLAGTLLATGSTKKLSQLQLLLN